MLVWHMEYSVYILYFTGQVMMENHVEDKWIKDSAKEPTFFFMDLSRGPKDMEVSLFFFFFFFFNINFILWAIYS